MGLSYAHGAIQWLSTDAVSTTYVISGLSFQPKALRFWWVGIHSATDASSETVNECRGVGFATSTSNRRCVGSFSQDTAATSTCGTVARNDAIACMTDGAGGSTAELDVDAITSDGFVAIVDDPADQDVTVYWETWGGTDITVATCGDWEEPTVTGDLDVTATGLMAGATDQVLMLAGVQSSAAINTAEAEASGMVVSFVTGTGIAQVMVGGSADHNSLAMDTDGWCHSGECASMVQKAGAAVLETRASWTQWNTDGFRLNYATTSLNTRKSIFLAMKGGSWQAGAYTIDGSTGGATATVSGLAFTPIGVSLIGRMTTEQASNVTTANDRLGFGSGSSTSSRRSMGVLDEDATASSVCEIDTTIQYDQVLCFPSTAGGLQAAYDINAMNSDGFQIIVDTAGGVASEWQGYVAFGDAPVAPSGEKLMGRMLVMNF